MSEVKTSSRIVDELSDILGKKEYTDVIEPINSKTRIPKNIESDSCVKMFFFKFIRAF